MKLYQIEQQSLIASQGLALNEVDTSLAEQEDTLPVNDTSKSGNIVKQVLITVSPKLCSAIKNHICRLKRYVVLINYCSFQINYLIAFDISTMFLI
jgi:hypothetical protein